MILRTLKSGFWDGRQLARRGVLLDLYTLRTAASRANLYLEGLTAEQKDILRRGQSAQPARTWLRGRVNGSVNITLAMIMRPQDTERVVASLGPLRPHFSDILFILDSDRVLASYHGIRQIARRLDGDFAGQRNRAQAEAHTQWVLQIDDDETLSASLLDALGWMIAQADRQGLRSIGFPRRNFVNGYLSDHYPDIQYRLNRRDIRYAGIVHERPDLNGRWQDSAIMLAGHIDHFLDGARVRARTKAYGAMHPDGARHADERTLLSRFQAC